MEQRLRHRARGDILPGDRDDPGGGVPALPTSRHPGGPCLRTRAHRDFAGGRARLLPEHLRATRHPDHGDLRPAALRDRRQLQRHVRRPAHQDQQDRQDLRFGLEVRRQAAVHQSDVPGLHRGRADRLSGKWIPILMG